MMSLPTVKHSGRKLSPPHITDKEEEKKLAGTLAKKELPTEGCSRRNGKRKRVRGRRKYQMIDNIMSNRLYEDTKRKAGKRVQWRMM